MTDKTDTQTEHKLSPRPDPVEAAEAFRTAAAAAQLDVSEKDVSAEAPSLSSATLAGVNMSLEEDTIETIHVDMDSSDDDDVISEEEDWDSDEDADQVVSNLIEAGMSLSSSQAMLDRSNVRTVYVPTESRQPRARGEKLQAFLDTLNHDDDMDLIETLLGRIESLLTALGTPGPLRQDSQLLPHAARSLLQAYHENAGQISNEFIDEMAQGVAIKLAKTRHMHRLRSEKIAHRVANSIPPDVVTHLPFVDSNLACTMLRKAVEATIVGHLRTLIETSVQSTLKHGGIPDLD